MKKLLAVGLFTALIINCLTAQVDLNPKRFAFDPQLTYDAAIKSPAQFLGYEPGTRFTVYDQVVDYCATLGDASPKVIYHEYGETYEHRPLVNLIITSEANMARLEEIRQLHIKAAEGTLTATEKEAWLQLPVIVTMSFNIHGNEASSTEAAMQIAYRLAAAQDGDTKDLLDHGIYNLFVCINPDGRDRYVYWYNSMRRNITGVEPADVEHYEPWPGGRTNHYWFDVNRDWVWGVHPEARGLTEEYQRWMGQVHVDYHEQGYNSNYFTVPGTTPRNKFLPDRYEAWADTFGRANVKAFDAHKINYFTRDAFDFFYPGYGSSYPSVMGSIGMLCEQGGIGAGIAITTDDDYVLIFKQRVWDHYTTALATMGRSVANRVALRQYSLNAWDPANNKSPEKYYFLRDDQGKGYLHDVLAILMRQNIRVDRLTQPVTVPAAISYRDGKAGKAVFDAGTYVVRADQPRYLMIATILDRQMEIEDSVMYDMATWSMPLAYNLDAYTCRQMLSLKSEPVTTLPALPSGMTGAANAYAYLIDWDQRYAPTALALLWEKGYQVRSSQEPFSDGTTTYPQGTLVILAGRNLGKEDVIAADMKSVAMEAQVEIKAIESGRMVEGMDLASRYSHPIEQPKVAMLVDDPFSSQTVGQISWLFDQETKLPVQRVRGSVLMQSSLPKFGQRYGYVDLNDYNVLILAGGGNGLNEVFAKEDAGQLKAWIQAGGTVIATESAVNYFTNNDEKSIWPKVTMTKSPKDTTKTLMYLPYSERQDYFGKKRIPGSALNGLVDNTNPLAFGVKKEVYSLNFGPMAIKPAAELQTVGYYVQDSSQVLASGYADTANLKVLAGNAFAAVVPLGRGKIVLLPDNTQFRMFWRGTSRMMQNAVMVVPGY